MIAQVVGNDVVAPIMQGLVLRKKVHLEAAEVGPGRQVSRVTITVTRHRMIADHQSVGFTRNEPAFNGHAIHCREENLLVLHAVFVGPAQNRRTCRVRHQISETVDKSVGWIFCRCGHRLFLSCLGKG
ncbi:hypothetical protein D3C71_1576950 [compost metagenome]